MKGVDAVEEGRVGVVERDGERVRREIREVRFGEALEAADERLGPARGVDGKAVGLKLVTARPGIKRD